MQKSLNPYREWLGLDVEGRPESHYALLGLTAGESDTESIAAARDSALQRLRDAKLNRENTVWSRVVQEVRTAAKCLLDDNTRTAYDQSLQRNVAVNHAAPVAKLLDVSSQSGPVVAPVAARLAEDSATAQAPETTGVDVVRTGSTSVRRRRRRWIPLPLVIATLLVAIVGTSFVLNRVLRDGELLPGSAQAEVAIRRQSDSPPRGTPKSGDRRSSDATSRSARHLGPGSPLDTGRSSPLADQSRPGARASSSETSARDAPSMAIQDAAGRTLAALAAADFPTADRLLELATGSAATPSDVELLSALRMLRTYTGQYWEGVNQSIAALRAGDELQYVDSPAVVVEATADRIVLRTAARNMTFQRDALPAELVRQLADRWFDSSDPVNLIARGAFEAVHSEGDGAAARKFWEMADRRGASTEKLLPLLNRPNLLRDRGDL